MTTQSVDQAHPILGFSHTWASKLAQRVQSLAIIALSVGEHNLPANVTVHSLGKERGVGRAGKFLNFQRIIAPLALRGAIDGIFVQQTEINAILATPYAKWRGIPLVLFKGHSRSLRPTLRIANRFIDCAITSTAAGYPIETAKKIVIGQGIDVDRFKPEGGMGPCRKRKRVISVGRLSPIKRYEVQIEAVKRLVHQRHRDDVDLYIYGGSDPIEYYDKLKSLVKSSNLQEHIHFKGPVSFLQMPDVYRTADLMIHTCDTDSLDKVVLEAMSSGVPAITSIHSYQNELGHYSNVLISHPDDPADLACKMEAVLDLRATDYRAIAQELREMVVRKHSVDHLADRIVAIIQELRNKKSRNE